MPEKLMSQVKKRAQIENSHVSVWVREAIRQRLKADGIIPDSTDLKRGPKKQHE